MSAASASALYKIKDIDILIESLDSAAAECGITKNMLDAAVRVPLSNSKLVIKSKTLNHLYVNANVLSLSNGMCAINLELNFMKFVESELDTGYFWTESTIMYTSKMNASTRVATALEAYTKQFMAAWLKANTN
jgi:hypothetical protein